MLCLVLWSLLLTKRVGLLGLQDRAVGRALRFASGMLPPLRKTVHERANGRSWLYDEELLPDDTTGQPLRRPKCTRP